MLYIILKTVCNRRLFSRKNYSRVFSKVTIELTQSPVPFVIIIHLRYCVYCTLLECCSILSYICIILNISLSSFEVFTKWKHRRSVVSRRYIYMNVRKEAGRGSRLYIISIKASLIPAVSWCIDDGSFEA